MTKDHEKLYTLFRTQVNCIEKSVLIYNPCIILKLNIFTCRKFKSQITSSNIPVEST